MEPLVLKPRQPVEDEIDCWDDDGDLEGDFEFRERDELDQDDVFSEAGTLPDLKIPKSRPPLNPVASKTLPVPSVNDAADDFEQDLQFPDDGEPLKLPTRKDLPKTPMNANDDFEEWAEGSLGTRYGGTRRDGRSHRSSSLSGMSPSISSSFTAESEDEGLDGLVLPDGPLLLDEVLKKRQTTVQSDKDTFPEEDSAAKAASVAKDDFFSDIDVGDGDVFDSGKQTLNRNIKQKKWQPSDTKKPLGLATMFSKKAALSSTRIPRPAASHERAKPTLEPVAESGPSLPTSRRPRAGTGGHSAQSSVSSIGMPQSPSSSQVHPPSTPSQQKEVGNLQSMRTSREQPTTTGSQLLKMKRSLPIIRNAPESPAKFQPSTTTTAAHHRPPTRIENFNRSAIPSRPKTPLDRSGAESSLSRSRKPPVPLLSGGTSQSYHASSKSARPFRRWDSFESNGSNEQLYNRPVSRLARASRTNLRSPSPRRKDLASESLAKEAASKRTLTRPTKTRRFGDGSELEVFDDLPTSVNNESKFTKAPSGRGAPKSVRAKPNQQIRSTPTTTPVPDRSQMQTPLPPPTPHGPPRHDFTPRFARDTNASRNAREQRIASSSGGPLAVMSTNWKAHVAARGQMNSPAPTPRSKRRHAGAQQKPHLIKPLGDTHMNAKSVKGMRYNPALYCWEGNENALSAFNGTSTANISGGGTPKPALISNLHTASPSVQVVGEMVFDPEKMRWLKLSKHQKDQQRNDRASTGGNESVGSPTSLFTGGRESGSAIDDDAASIDSDDPFADLPDLDDRPVSSSRRGPSDGDDLSQLGSVGQKPLSAHPGTLAAAAPVAPRSMGSTQDDWLVGEEFDVGPEFIRRQREEEDRWRRKVGRWISKSTNSTTDSIEDLGSGREEWRWSIRDLALGGGEHGYGSGHDIRGSRLY
ncbi:MAG: hypothetical protein M4579_002379 [Chaenotheca gracillima]|nr:MAG: hypothetical protein M4579_002379 [Chaenotheca gracillima]